MTKTYCDRCGMLTDNPMRVYHYDRLKDNPYVFDCELCAECQKSFRNFIKGARVVIPIDPIERKKFE